MKSIMRRRQTMTVPAIEPAPLTEAEIWVNLGEYATAAVGAFAVNTERAMRSDIARFTDWCRQEARQAVPASPETVAAFVDAMAASRAPSTVRRYVASVASFHRAAEVANPCETQAVKLALRRMHNAKGRAQVQASPLNEGAIRKLLEARGGGRRRRNPMRGLRDKALLVTGYVTLCRQSELTALRFDDLKVEADGFATIVIRRSKTDQEGRGAVVPIPADAMQHLAKWITAARIKGGALFRAVRHGGSIGGPLDPGAVARIFKTMAADANLVADKAGQPLRISGHSTRIGGAVDMLRYKETLAAIMVSGRWKSPEMVGRYVQEQAARDSAASRIAAERKRSGEPF
jgi:site-specific recombinase XerD